MVRLNHQPTFPFLSPFISYSPLYHYYVPVINISKCCMEFVWEDTNRWVQNWLRTNCAVIIATSINTIHYSLTLEGPSSFPRAMNLTSSRSLCCPSIPIMSTPISSFTYTKISSCPSSVFPSTLQKCFFGFDMWSIFELLRLNSWWNYI